jgi:hypothetical protein
MNEVDNMSEDKLEAASDTVKKAEEFLAREQGILIKEWVLDKLKNGDLDEDTRFERVSTTFRKPATWKGERFYRIVISTLGEGYVQGIIFDGDGTRSIPFPEKDLVIFVDGKAHEIEVILSPSNLKKYPATLLALEEIIRTDVDRMALALADIGAFGSLGTT